MFRVPSRRLRPTPAFRRRLASVLLVLYVAALHGLPALHLAFHHNDHVHELGGLRWIRQLPQHVHTSASADVHQEAAEASQVPGEPRQAPRHHLRAAVDPSTKAAALHLAVGPAHAQSYLVVPLHPVYLVPGALSAVPALPLLAPRLGILFSQHRARAPPVAV